MLRDGLDKVLSNYLKIMTEIENDGLISALGTIVERFGQEVQPYSLELIEHIATIFLKANQQHLNKDENQEEDDEEGDPDEEEEDK